MAYIGTEPIVGQYRKLDSIAASFNGSATTFNLTVGSVPVTAGTAYQLLISVGGVVQEPGVDYTVNTNTITFTTAPTTGLSFFGVLMGDTLNIGTPSDGTITDAKLGSITTLSATNLRVNGATSGYSQLNAPAVAGNQTFTFPGTGGTLDRLNRAGNVLQVVNATYGTETTTSSTSYVDTNLTGTITPTASSSKILVIVSQHGRIYDDIGTPLGSYQLLRGATVLLVRFVGAIQVGDQGTPTLYENYSCSYLDSPATTSAVTYKTQMRVEATGTGRVIVANGAAGVNTTSTITLMEIAA